MMTALVSLVSLTALVLFVLFPYNRYRVDRFRQDIFALRDDLFMEAARGKIAFDNPAYIATRTTLNGMIRFAHRLSVSRLFMISRLIKKPELDRFQAEFKGAFVNVTFEERQLCEKYLRNANGLVAYHVTTSPTMFVFIVPLLGTLIRELGLMLVSSLLKKRSEPLKAMDSFAYNLGKPQTAAPAACASSHFGGFQ